MVRLNTETMHLVVAQVVVAHEQQEATGVTQVEVLQDKVIVERNPVVALVVEEVEKVQQEVVEVVVLKAHGLQMEDNTQVVVKEQTNTSSFNFSTTSCRVVQS